MLRRNSKKNKGVPSQKSQKRGEVSEREGMGRKAAFRCKSCGKRFSKVQKYKQHLKFHKYQQCTICEPGFGAKVLRTERKLKRSKKHVHCQVCKLRLACRLHLKSHSNCQKWKVKQHCSKCSRRYFSMLTLVLHMKSHSEEKCGGCGKVFSTGKILKIHACRKDGDKNELTEKSQPIIIMEVTSQDVDKGEITAHSAEQHPQSSIKKHVCQICQKSFSSASCRSRHQRVHTREKRYKCDDCEEKFSERALLVAHMVKHTGIPLPRKFVCDICGKGFTRSTILSVHKRTHGSKDFRCEQCNKAFPHQKILDRHMTTHNGDRQYPCEYCVKKFLIKSNLKRHMLVHTGEKPFKCQKCDKTFSQAVNLKTHERIHSGERPFTCDVCGKSFAQKVNLKHHIHVHACDTLLQCEYCDQAFTVPANLQNHVDCTHLQLRHGEREMPEVEFQEVEISTMEDVQNADEPRTQAASYEGQAMQREVCEIGETGPIPNPVQAVSTGNHPIRDPHNINNIDHRAQRSSIVQDQVQVSEASLQEQIQSVPGSNGAQQSTINPLPTMHTFRHNLQHHPESNLLLVAELAYRQQEYDLATRAQSSAAQPNTVLTPCTQFGYDTNTQTHTNAAVFQLQAPLEKSNSNPNAPVPFASQHILVPAVQAHSILQTPLPVSSPIQFSPREQQNNSGVVELAGAGKNAMPLCGNVAYVMQTPNSAQLHPVAPAEQSGQVQRVQCGRCSQVFESHFDFFEHSEICK